jgi:SAM-dependent methyltransferase
MHPTAKDNARLFLDVYVKEDSNKLVVDIGAQNINGSLKEIIPSGNHYIGVDFVHGAGVDVVLEDPYCLPFESSSVDVVLSSSCFEHIEFFWLIFNEILRVLKPQGLFYLNSPANGEFHRYPLDCWRFYPDAGKALVNWGNRSGYSPLLLESYTSLQRLDIWNDFVAVFLKEQSCLAEYPTRMLDRIDDYTNGMIHGHADILRPQFEPEDLARLQQLTGRLKPDK